MLFIKYLQLTEVGPGASEIKPGNMMMNTTLRVIGTVRPFAEGFRVTIDKDYAPGLKGLSDFSHAIVVWLAHETDTDGSQHSLSFPSPYTASEEAVGVFATRSPQRPNPVCFSIVHLLSVDETKGVITTHFIDTLPDTPVIDIKPYFPASDLVKSASIPRHFGHWPSCYEGSASFDWDAEFR